MAKEYVFYLKQNIGAPAAALVKAGDYVKRGERIAARLPGKLGAHLYSSINGKVIRVNEEAIYIEAIETDFTTYEKLKGSTAKELVEEAGIVGLGGAGFPTSVKLETALTDKGAVIINAAECEPILSHNIARLNEDPEKLLRGLRLVMEILSVKRGIIAIKSKHQNTIKRLKVADHDHICEIAELEDMYPMGEERAIIRDTLGVLLSTDALPAQADAVVLNAETVLRIREAVEDRKPLIDKDLTVGGKLKDAGQIKVLKDVPIGMKVTEVFELAGGIGEEYGEIIMGGPFTGVRAYPEQGIKKTTGGLLAAEAFLKGPEKIGLLVCACGADENRLREIADSMGSQVAGTEYCKQAHANHTAYKCENPGHCPGQVGKVMELKRQGAQALLISNCTDCTNTVMSCAPKLGLPVFHCTDGSLRAVNHKLIRRNHKNDE